MYGKLFAQMYDGTLATRGPWQALVTFQQLVILAGKDGTVDMTVEALSRRTSIPLEIIQTGLAALEQPDPESRTPDEDGRRIVRLSARRSWGWRIVNYGKYRAIRTEDERSEYKRQWDRDHRRRPTKSDKSDKSDNFRQIRPIAEAEAEEQTPLSTPSARTSGRAGTKPGNGQAFDRFWTLYPKKVKKQDALKAWRKLKPDEALISEILDAVERAKGSPDWQREGGQFIPHPSSWLNGRRWEDETPDPPKQKWHV